MGEYVNLMVGTLNGQYPPGTINRIIADLNQVAPMRTELLLPKYGNFCALVGEGFIVHLVYEPGDDEPWSSHVLTANIDRRDPDLDTVDLAGRFYDALVETRRYRVLVEYREEVLRSTHFPPGPW